MHLFKKYLLFINNMQNNERITINPWNTHNKVLTKEDVYTIFTKCGFKNVKGTIEINDLSLYQTAFIHGSYTKKTHDTNEENVERVPKPENCIDLYENDYEDMEFLGDRCLELAVVYYIFRRYPDTDPGFKTKLKSKLVKKDSLAKFATYLGFSKHLIVSNQVDEKTNLGRQNPRILEDVMEAFICAIFLDQNKSLDFYSDKANQLEKIRLIGPGWEIVNAFVENLIELCIDFEELVMTEDNHKEILLQYYQKQFKITPKYLELGIEGPPHNRVFTMGVLDNSGDIISRGVAKSKKEAEQIASKKALEYFDQL